MKPQMITCGAYALHVVGPEANWQTELTEIRFKIPAGSPSEAAWTEATRVGRKKWKRFLEVQEVWGHI